MRPLPIVPLLAVAVVFPLAGQQPGAATPIEMGREYTGGTRVAAPLVGVTFAIPAGKLGGLDQEVKAFLIGSRDTPNQIAGVFAYSEGTIDEVANEIYEVLSAQGMQLAPRGQPVTNGSTVSAVYDAMTPQGRGLVYGTIRLGPEGNSIAVAAFGPADQEAQLRKLGDDIVASAQFSQPMIHQYRNQVGGARLVRGAGNSAYSPGGVGDGSYASQTDERYDLCSDGSYAYYMKSESFISVEGAGSASSTEEDGHQGRWGLVADIMGGATLVVEATDGRAFYLPVEETEDGVLLDGVGYGPSASPICR